MKHILSTLLLLWQLSAYTQLTTNTFTGTSACPTNGNTFSVVSNASVAPLSRNTITCNSTANVFNSTTLNNTSSRNDNSYIEFSITANAGYTLNLTSLSFFRQASNAAPNQLVVSYSTDAANFNTTRTDMAVSTTPTSGTVLTWTFSSAITTASGGTVTFRFYPYGTQRADLAASPAASSTGTFRLDDVTLFGSVIASAGNTAQVSVSPSSGSETAQTTFTVTVTTSANVLVNSNVDYSISGFSSSDFVGSPSLSGTVTINAGSNSNFFNLQVNDDIIPEGLETGNITLSNPTGSITGIGGSPASLSITDNDSKYYWNGGNISATPASGGSGLWTTTNAWRQPDASGSQATWADNNDAVLSGTAGNVTITDGSAIQPKSLQVSTTGYNLSSNGGTTTIFNSDITLDAGVNLNLNEAAATANRTLSIKSVNGGAGSSLTLQGAQTGTNNSRVNLSVSNAKIDVPVILSNSGASTALVGFVGTATGTSIEKTITNNSINARTMLGATNSNSLSINAAILGSAGVQFSAGSSGGGGVINVNSAAGYTGPTTINTATSGTVKLGVNNALPANGLTVTAGILDLNGYNLSIGTLSGAAGSIVNNGAGATNQTLSINQSANQSVATAINDGTSFISVQKGGTADLTLTSTNTFSGGLKLNAGKIILGSGNILSNNLNVEMNGGALRTGATTGYNETIKQLQLSDNSGIELGSGSHTLAFSNSSAIGWTSGKTLTISGWVGTAGNTGSAGKIKFGVDNTGLSSSQLAQITFTGYGPGAIILNDGEIVPSSATLNVDQTGFTNNFGSVNVGSSSTEQTFTVDGTSLASTVVITPPTGFEISTTSGSGFQTSALTLNTTSGVLALTTIYVRFSPLAAKAYSGNITVVSGSVAQNVAVSGTGVISTLYSRGNGLAASDAIWSYTPTGTGQTITALGGFQNSSDVIIQSGHTVLTRASQEITAKNLEIQSGAVLKGDPANTGNFTPFYVNVYGDINVEGEWGQADGLDSIALNYEGATGGITGSGSINLARIRKSTNSPNATSNLTLEANLNLHWSATALYNNASSTFNFLQSAGTLNLINNGDIAVDGTNGQGSGNRNGTFSFASLVTGIDTLYALCDNTSGTTSISVLSGGELNAKRVIRGHAGTPSGAFTLNVSTGGTLNIWEFLELQKQNFAPAGSVILKSTSANFTAILNNFSSGFSGTYTGNILVERYVPVSGSNQHFISSPVNSPSFTQLGATGPDEAWIIPNVNCDETASAGNSPYGTVFEYVDGHMPNGGCMLGNWKIQSAGNMENGRGYSAYLNGNSVTTFNGAPNTGNISVSTFNSGFSTVNTLQGSPIESGWNLVGNAYPSSIQLTNGRSGFQNQVQLWVTNGPFSGTWQSGFMNNGVSSISIAPGQSFMVRQTGSTGVSSFPLFQSERTTALNTVFYSLQTENSLQLEVNFNGVKDVTQIDFNAAATNNFDDVYDANKMSGAAGRPTLYTHMNSNTWYSINTVPSLQQVTAVPMGLRPEVNGTMTISAKGINTFDPTAYIILEDTKTGIFHNLRDGDYTFTTTTTDNQHRFIVHFTPGVGVNHLDATCRGNDGSIELNTIISGNWSYQLTNSSGFVRNGLLNSLTEIDSLVSGVYQLTLTDTNGYSVVKNILIESGILPDATFAASANTVNANETVVFTQNNTSSVSNWLFGDGNSLSTSSMMVTHQYTQEGVYQVTLEVVNDEGCSSVSTELVAVNKSLVSGVNHHQTDEVNVFSSNGQIIVNINKTDKSLTEIGVYNLIGQQLNRKVYSANGLYTIDTDKGAQVVVVKVTGNNNTSSHQIFIR